MSGITKIISFTSLLFLLSFSLVSAATFAPTAQDLKINQGESGLATFAIVNDSKVQIKYQIDLLSVTLGSGPDDLQFSKLSEPGLSISLSDRELTLEGGEGKEIAVLVAAESKARSGVRIFGLRIIEVQNSGSSINIAEGFVGLVFVTVGDDLAEGAELLDFSTNGFLRSYLPVKFLATFRNNGERVVQPEGKLVVSNLLGFKKQEIEINPEFRRLASGQDRTLQVLWGGRAEPEGFFEEMKAEASQLRLGIYRAKLEAVPWQGGTPMKATVHFVIFPWRLFLVVGGLFLGLTLLLRVSRK